VGGRWSVCISMNVCCGDKPWHRIKSGIFFIVPKIENDIIKRKMKDKVVITEGGRIVISSAS
jgi:hypothetical protein